MSSAWGQVLLMAGLAVMVHLPIRAETTASQPTLMDANRHTTGSWQKTRQASRLHDRPDLKATTGTAAVVAHKLSIFRVLNQISDQSGVPICLRGNLEDVEVSLVQAKPQPVAQVLRTIEATSPRILVKETPAGFEVWDRATYNEQARELRTYQLKFVPVQTAERALREVLTKNTGSSTRSDEHNALAVYDVPEKQAEVAEVISQLDKELPTRVFTLSYANPDQVAKQLEQFLLISSRQISADVRSRKVIVRAPESQMQLAAKLIQAFDMPGPPPNRYQ